VNVGTYREAPATLKSRFAPLIALTVWLAFGAAFLVVRPGRFTTVYWLLLVPTFLAGGAAMWLQHLQTRLDRRAQKRWEARLKSLSVDIGGDSHLYQMLDPPEWDRVFQYLETCPPSARNLRDAIYAVDPTYFDSG